MKALTELDKQHIKDQLKKEGRKIFAAYGLKKATIRQLSQAACISSGSFYLFYDSKESLFMEILLCEMKKHKDEVDRNLMDLSIKPQQMIKMFLKNVISQIQTNPIFSRLLLNEEREHLYLYMSNKHGEINHDNDFIKHLLSTVICDWQTKGMIIDDSPEVISGLIRSVFLLSTQKDVIGEDIYDNVLDMLVDFISAGLTSNK